MSQLVAFRTQSLRLGLKRLRNTSSTGVSGLLGPHLRRPLDTRSYRSCLEIARALREQIDWDDVRERSADTPFGRAFFVIAEGLGVV